MAEHYQFKCKRCNLITLIKDKESKPSVTEAPCCKAAVLSTDDGELKQEK